MQVTYHSRFLDRYFIFETGELSKTKKKYGLDDIMDAAGLTFNDDNMNIHIWMPSFSPSKTTDVSTLAHEIVHAASFGLDFAQIPLFQRDADGNLNTETLAYLVGDLTEAFMKKAQKRGKKKATLDEVMKQTQQSPDTIIVETKKKSSKSKKRQ